MVTDLEGAIMLSSACLVDEFTTALGCHLYGIKLEAQSWRRRLMNRFGIWKSLPLQTIIQQGVWYSFIGCMYLLEKTNCPEKPPDSYRHMWIIATFPPAYASLINLAYLGYKGIESAVRMHRKNNISYPITN